MNKFGLKRDVCSYIEPSCGYGEPLDASTCSYCDGKCLRPRLKAVPDPKIYACDEFGICPYVSDHNEPTGMYLCRDMCGLGVDEDTSISFDYESDIID